MFEDLKNAITGTVEKKESSGQWINGKFVPNQPEQQYYQPQQYQQPQQPMPQQYQQPQQPMQPQYQQPMYQQPQQQGGMQCPKCKGYNVNVQIVEVGSKSTTKKSKNGVGGHLHNQTRAVLAMSTFGMSNLVVKKADGKEKTKTKTKTQTMCVCQNCGKTWKV